MDDQNMNNQNNEDNDLQKELEAQIEDATKQASGDQSGSAYNEGADIGSETTNEASALDAEQPESTRESEGNGIAPDLGTAKEQLNQEDGIEIL